MVKRYTWAGVHGLIESEKGNWVDYEDYQNLEAELEALRQQVAAGADDGWIEWVGGECPVEDNKRVEVKFRDGFIGQDVAFWLGWSHGGDDNDIIAYRVVKPPRQLT